MMRRPWKSYVPRSAADAMSACAEHALARYNRGIERLATEHLGQHGAATLYKWMGNARLPLNLILPFEHASGFPGITRYLAAAHGCLLVPIPTGRTATAEDIQQLQSVLNEAVGALLAFTAKTKSATDTLDAIRSAMESLAWHHGNVQQHERPQLDFGDTPHE